MFTYMYKLTYSLSLRFGTVVFERNVVCWKRNEQNQKDVSEIGLNDILLALSYKHTLYNNVIHVSSTI